MKKHSISLFILSIASVLSLSAYGQQGGMAVSWKLLELQNAAGKSQAQFIIKNTGIGALPLSATSLWFNSMRSVNAKSVKAPYALSHQNGDLYQLSFGSKASLPAGDSLVVDYQYVSKIVNYTDAPEGLYTTGASGSQNPRPLTNYTVLPYFGAQQKLFAALEKQYEENENLTNFAGQQQSSIRIIPQPAHMQVKAGSFMYSAATTLSIAGQFQAQSAAIRRTLAQLPGNYQASQKIRNSKSHIAVNYKGSLHKEEYNLNISPFQVSIEASSAEGVFYALQSIRQLLPANTLLMRRAFHSIPALSIQDKPRFGYRGFMLDIARNFKGKQEILQIIDQMAGYKLNTLHLHFSDDEGWRLEIPALPELTQVGSVRSASYQNGQSLQPGYGSGANAPARQYLSRQDFIDILKYARDRYIRVIPEIETPGHARAAIKSMDARYERLRKQGKLKEAEEFLLRDAADKSVYSSAQYWNDNVMNVALPSTYRFLETVIDALADMYRQAGLTLQKVHMGADEVPKGAWEGSPLISSLMKKENLRTIHEVWPWYVGRLQQLFKRKNLTLAGWEELGMVNKGKGMQANPTFAGTGMQVDVWNSVIGGGNEDLAYKMANMGYKVVFASAHNVYFDLAWNDVYEEPGHTWAALINLERTFSFLPSNYFHNIRTTGAGQPLKPGLLDKKERLTPAGEANIIGIKAALWEEKVKTRERMHYMIFPRLLALAERAWTPKPVWEMQDQPQAFRQDWYSFLQQVNQQEYQRLFQQGIHFRVPDIGMKISGGQLVCNSPTPDISIHYTTDGSIPTTQSKVYSGPIPAGDKVVVTSFYKNKLQGKIIRLKP